MLPIPPAYLLLLALVTTLCYTCWSTYISCLQMVSSIQAGTMSHSFYSQPLAVSGAQCVCLVSRGWMPRIRLYYISLIPLIL
jgi:hypothetical protein